MPTSIISKEAMMTLEQIDALTLDDVVRARGRLAQQIAASSQDRDRSGSSTIQFTLAGVTGAPGHTLDDAKAYLRGLVFLGTIDIDITRPGGALETFHLQIQPDIITVGLDGSRPGVVTFPGATFDHHCIEYAINEGGVTSGEFEMDDEDSNPTGRMITWQVQPAGVALLQRYNVVDQPAQFGIWNIVTRADGSEAGGWNMRGDDWARYPTRAAAEARIVADASSMFPPPGRQEVREIAAADRPAGYELDGEPVGLELFIAENEFDAAEIAAIRGLAIGEEYPFGGGAAALTVLRRVR